MRSLKISTEQLAKICGVSQGTVDRALNGRRGINEKTKQKIIDTAVKYGYRPCSEKTLKHVGIIVFNLNNEYLTELVSSLEDKLFQTGYTATVMLSHYDKNREIECIKKLYSSGVDGIILCSNNSGNDFIRFISGLNIPVFWVGKKIDGMPYVGINDFAAMKDMTCHVLNQKYKQIIYFSPALTYSDAYAQKQRFSGFMAGLSDFSDYSVVTDFEQIKTNYDKNTAIICSTDYYALKVYFKGVSADVFGFDNIKMLEEYSLPIHSVDYSVKEIADKAVEALFSNQSDDTIVSHRI